MFLARWNVEGLPVPYPLISVTSTSSAADVFYVRNDDRVDLQQFVAASRVCNEVSALDVTATPATLPLIVPVAPRMFGAAIVCAP